MSTVGRLAGKVAAYSTIGSIVGTFLPVFLMIPFLGTQKTIWSFAAVLMILSIFGLLKTSSKQSNL
jgi:VIT1/CCC1 family predicted Fe2+/Mn2+ transporter